MSQMGRGIHRRDRYGFGAKIVSRAILHSDLFLRLRVGQILGANVFSL